MKKDHMIYMSCLGGPVLETTAFQQGDSHIYLYMVGYDYFGPTTWHLMINMHCTPTGNEFMFGLATADRFKGIVGNTFDSAIANQIVPKQHRAGLREILISQAEKIVRSMNLDSFFMVTYLVNLPQKALAKYDELAQVFRSCGYNVIVTEPETGKHMWQMARFPVEAHDPASVA